MFHTDFRACGSRARSADGPSGTQACLHLPVMPLILALALHSSSPRHSHPHRACAGSCRRRLTHDTCCALRRCPCPGAARPSAARRPPQRQGPRALRRARERRARRPSQTRLARSQWAARAARAANFARAARQAPRRRAERVAHECRSYCPARASRPLTACRTGDAILEPDLSTDDSTAPSAF
jgi:hypothetical protein